MKIPYSIMEGGSFVLTASMCFCQSGFFPEFNAIIKISVYHNILSATNLQQHNSSYLALIIDLFEMYLSLEVQLFHSSTVNNRVYNIPVDRVKFLILRLGFPG